MIYSIVLKACDNGFVVDCAPSKIRTFEKSPGETLAECSMRAVNYLREYLKKQLEKEAASGESLES